MARAKWAVAARRRRKRLFKATEGFRAGRKRLVRHAIPTLMRSLVYARRDRHNRKREFRGLWIARLNAACRMQGITYAQLMRGLRVAQVQLDRKHLADVAAHDQLTFQQLVALATTPK